MQMKCKCNANEMKCDQMPNKCIILGTIQLQSFAPIHIYEILVQARNVRRLDEQ